MVCWSESSDKSTASRTRASDTRRPARHWSNISNRARGLGAAARTAWTWRASRYSGSVEHSLPYFVAPVPFGGADGEPHGDDLLGTGRRLLPGPEAWRDGHVVQLPEWAMVRSGWPATGVEEVARNRDVHRVANADEWAIARHPRPPATGAPTKRPIPASDVTWIVPSWLERWPITYLQAPDLQALEWAIRKRGVTVARRQTETFSICLKLFLETGRPPGPNARRWRHAGLPVLGSFAPQPMKRLYVRGESSSCKAVGYI